MPLNFFPPDLRPKWIRTEAGALVPDVDEQGVQRMVSVETRFHLPWPTGPANSAISAGAWFALSKGWPGDQLGHIWVYSDAGGINTDFTLKPDKRAWWALPANTQMIAVMFPAGRIENIGWGLEVAPK